MRHYLKLPTLLIFFTTVWYITAKKTTGKFFLLDVPVHACLLHPLTCNLCFYKNLYLFSFLNAKSLFFLVFTICWFFFLNQEDFFHYRLLQRKNDQLLQIFCYGNLTYNHLNIKNVIIEIFKVFIARKWHSKKICAESKQGIFLDIQRTYSSLSF